MIIDATLRGDCFGCGNCLAVCPMIVRKRNGDGEFVEEPILKIKNGSSNFINKEGCNFCGECIRACPRTPP
ncbi:hypothetical protein AKJ51_01125 [candidate division MSBL1 archaeon SCGC-AAA382A20]|uniref:4Fe-4S ferredoxin-type domain-containing protein n=1 Tax=candidate division MSBL1 archaeon SCGC-AAA382A20 TaxID=1698280 RepID=A0A133VM92_9EURY|nr:hypothetical protein AKJ51_01125 [candidate division MSBL1 archaeon SCGC-AAA382A20]